MNILIFGATGYIGSRVAQECMNAGHNVTGLVRNASRASALTKGIKPLIGDLAQPGEIIKACTDFDAIINTGFPSHGREWSESVALEKNLHLCLVEALSHTNKTLIVTNGTIFLGDSGEEQLTEETSIQTEHPASIRAHSTEVALDGSKQGIRAIELRLASFVYGEGGSTFLPVLTDKARRSGQSIYVGDGDIGTSTVHVRAAARAFVSALENGKAGEVYHIAGDEEPLVRQISEAIAVGVGSHCHPISVNHTEAVEITDFFTAMFLTTNNRLSSLKARRELGWSGSTNVSMLWDVAHGSYSKNNQLQTPS